MATPDAQILFSEALIATDEEWKYKAQQVGKLIRKSGGMLPLDRMAVYKSTGLNAKVSALRQIYPVCEKILGVGVFKHITQAYAKKHASLHYDLNLYGDGFASFIGNVNQLKKAGGFEYLEDLCVLEYCWHAVYYEKNDLPFDFEAFAEKCDSPDSIVFELSYSLKLLTSEYPVEKIWCEHQHDKTLATIDSLNGNVFLCVFRQNFKPTIEVLSQPYYEFLKACMNGMSLGMMAEKTEIAGVLPELSMMIQKGWISGFRVV